MKNKTILSIAIFAISLLIIPQMTFASWWKPNTWKIFNRKSEVKIERTIIATSTPNSAISQTEKATTTPTLSRSSGQSVGAEKIEQKSEEVRKPKAASSFADTRTQKNDQSKEIEKLKKELEVLKQKQSQFKIIEKITEKPVIAEKKESSSSQTKQNENIVTLPNGAVVEMDTNGNVARTIKEAPQQTYVVPAPATQTQQTSDTNITIPKIKLSMGSNSVKAIPSTSNQILAKFTIYSQDGNVNSSKSVFKISISNGTGKTDDLSNFLFVDKNGSIVAGPVIPNNEGVLIFTDTVTFPKGTMEYVLKGNIGSNFSGEQWIYVSANTDNWILKITEESKPHIQPFQASEMGVFVSSQTNQLDNNGNYMVNINLTSLTDLTSLFVKLVNKETGIEYQQATLRNVNNYSVTFTNIPSGNYNLKMIADATTLVGIVQTFTSGILVQ